MTDVGVLEGGLKLLWFLILNYVMVLCILLSRYAMGGG